MSGQAEIMWDDADDKVLVASEANKWPEYNLNIVYDFASGLSKPREEFGFGFGFLSFKDVFHNYFLPDTLSSLVNSTEKERKSGSIKRGDLFLTRTSETQEELGMSSVALKDYPEATFNGFTKRLRPKGTVEVLPEFAGFFFRSPRFRAEVTSMSSVTTRASLNNEMMSALKITVPPFPEQRAIANVLGCLNDKLELLHRQNVTLEALAETIFRKWFIEEVKENWNIMPLDELLTISSGKTLKREHFQEDGLYPVYGANGEIGRTNQYLFDKKLIFTGRVGTLGNVFIVNDKKVWLSDNTLVVVPNNHFYFIYFALKSARLGDYNAGSTQPLIRQSDVKQIEVAVADELLLDEFESQAFGIFERIEHNKLQIQTIKVLRDTLLPKLMSGEVRVAY